MHPDAEYSRVMLRTAAEAETVPAWVDYARYCRLREQGLRPRALAHLDDFLREAGRWPFAERHAFVAWLARALEDAGYPWHDLTAHPLVTRLVWPTLLEWIEREPASVLPHRWLGILFPATRYAPGGRRPGAVPLQPAQHLRRAVELDAREQPARVRLVGMLLGTLDFSVHHLPDGYIGEPEDDLALAEEAAALVEGVADPRVRASLRSELAEATQLVEDWIAFRRTGGGDFDAWCRARGRAYAWQRHYYYPEE